MIGGRLAIGPDLFVAREQFAYSLDQRVFLDRKLRLGLFLQIFLAVLDLAERGTESQILDLNLAARLLITALNDRAGRAAPVSIFELCPDIVFRVAQVKLGANVGRTQCRD